MNLDWSRLASLCGGRLVSSGTVAPGRAVIDSRAARAGDVFVALKGRRVDGHDFVGDVASRGAAGAILARIPDPAPDGFGLILVDDALGGLQKWAAAHRSMSAAKVIGITGSNGKTTTKEMLAHVLRALGRSVCATRGNLNSQIGMPLMLLDIEPGHTHAVLEMGASSLGDLAVLGSMARPSMAVVTGIGRAHLETFGSLEGVLRAKWELVESLGRDGVAFLNADDPRLALKRKEALCSVVTFGRTPTADVRAENVRPGPRVAFDLVVGSARRTVTLPAPGVFNVGNALAAAAVALWERCALPEVAGALESFSPPPQRMQAERKSDGTLFVIDAYNANPDSMAASLDSFASAYPALSKTVVAGSMLELGSSSEEEHRRLGTLLAGGDFKRVFFVGPEGPWVRQAYERAGGRGEFVTADSSIVTDALRKDGGPGAAVLFKASRGVKLETIYEPLLKEK